MEIWTSGRGNRLGHWRRDTGEVCSHAAVEAAGVRVPARLGEDDDENRDEDTKAEEHKQEPPDARAQNIEEDQVKKDEDVAEADEGDLPPAQENRQPMQGLTNKHKIKHSAAGENKKPRILKASASCPAESPTGAVEPAL